MSSKSFDLSWFTDPRDEQQLKRLLFQIDSLASRQLLAADEFEELFSVFERFPEQDGYESFWQLLHALESFEGCDNFLVQSVRRRPCEFNLTMINRLINSGVGAVQGQSLVGILADVAKDNTRFPDAAPIAAHFIEYQERKRNGV